MLAAESGSSFTISESSSRSDGPVPNTRRRRRAAVASTGSSPVCDLDFRGDPQPQRRRCVQRGRWRRCAAEQGSQHIEGEKDQADHGQHGPVLRQPAHGPRYDARCGDLGDLDVLELVTVTSDVGSLISGPGEQRCDRRGDFLGDFLADQFDRCLFFFGVRLLGFFTILGLIAFLPDLFVVAGRDADRDLGQLGCEAERLLFRARLGDVVDRRVLETSLVSFVPLPPPPIEAG